MAINKITAGLADGPSVFATPVINQLAALLTDCNHRLRVSGGYVKAGSLWNIGGTMFLADSDTVITGTRTANTTGVKFTVSGNTATVSYGIDAITWNGLYQGYYDTSGNLYYKGEVIAGTYVVVGIDYISGSYGTSYTKMYEYQVNHGGIYSIKTRIRTDIGTTTFYEKVYINDVAVGTELSASGGNTFYTRTENIFIEDRDKISVYAKNNTYAGSANVFGLYIMNGNEGEVTL